MVEPAERHVQYGRPSVDAPGEKVASTPGSWGLGLGVQAFDSRALTKGHRPSHLPGAGSSACPGPVALQPPICQGCFPCSVPAPGETDALLGVSLPLPLP